MRKGREWREGEDEKLPEVMESLAFKWRSGREGRHGTERERGVGLGKGEKNGERKKEDRGGKYCTEKIAYW